MFTHLYFIEYNGEKIGNSLYGGLINAYSEFLKSKDINTTIYKSPLRRPIKAVYSIESLKIGLNYCPYFDGFFKEYLNSIFNKLLCI